MKPDEFLPSHLEFELSRLIEKYIRDILHGYREIHYHIKVELEKKELERQDDFNTVASFTVLDSNK